MAQDPFAEYTFHYRRTLDNKRIVLQSDSYFEVIPKLIFNHGIKLNRYIERVQQSNQYFAWIFDHQSNIIYINPYLEIIDSHIYDNFNKIVMWLLKRNYDINGMFYYRYGPINYTIFAHDSKIIYRMTKRYRQPINYQPSQHLFQGKTELDHSISILQNRIFTLECQIRALHTQEVHHTKRILIFGGLLLICFCAYLYYYHA